jgi:hypothetical protein
MSRAIKQRRKNRGMPPPAMFNIDTLPGSSNLTALEVAAVSGARPGRWSSGAAIRTIP